MPWMAIGGLSVFWTICAKVAYGAKLPGKGIWLLGKAIRNRNQKPISPGWLVICPVG